MKKFENKHTCPKCLLEEFDDGLEILNKQKIINHFIYKCVVVENLAREEQCTFLEITCPRCEYSWKQECADTDD